MLEFMHPALAARRTLRIGRTTGLNETSRRVSWPAAGITHAQQHVSDIGGKPTEGPASAVQRIFSTHMGRK